MSPRRAGLIALWIAGTAVVVLAGVWIGRITAPGPDIVVTSGAVAEDAPVESMPVFRPSDSYSLSQPVSFTSGPSLPDEPTTALGYRLVRSGVTGSGLASGVAAVLDVPGDVVPTVDGWSLATTDGSGGRLSVANDDALTWTYTREEPTGVSDAESAGVVAAVPAPRRAQRIAEDVLASLGVDLESIALQTARTAEGVEVNAWQLVDGLGTSLRWTVLIGPGGDIIRASGFGSSLQVAQEYPVVGAATAVDRTSEPLWSSLGPVRVLTASTDDVPAVPPSPTSTTVAPNALRVESTSLVIDGAELGLAEYLQPNGSVLILPTYEVTADDESRWAVPAVADEYVAFVAAPLPPADGDSTTVIP